MDYSTVLNINPITHRNGVYISPNYGLVPDRAIVSHDNFTDQGSILSKKTIFSIFRGKAPH
jgi:hypothetical protein